MSRNIIARLCNLFQRYQRLEDRIKATFTKQGKYVYDCHFVASFGQFCLLWFGRLGSIN